jgi:hypothetical protein
MKPAIKALTVFLLLVGSTIWSGCDLGTNPAGANPDNGDLSGQVTKTPTSCSNDTGYACAGETCFKILSPNGGEVLKVGDSCTVTFVTKESDQFTLYISLNQGLSWFSLVEEAGVSVVVPDGESEKQHTFTFEIPENFSEWTTDADGNLEENRQSSVSDEALVKLEVYAGNQAAAQESTSDVSDCTFFIEE